MEIVLDMNTRISLRGVDVFWPFKIALWCVGYLC